MEGEEEGNRQRTVVRSEFGVGKVEGSTLNKKIEAVEEYIKSVLDGKGETISEESEEEE